MITAKVKQDVVNSEEMKAAQRKDVSLRKLFLLTETGVEKVGSLDYRIEINGKRKTYHVNLLKKYVERDNVEKKKTEKQYVLVW